MNSSDAAAGNIGLKEICPCFVSTVVLNLNICASYLILWKANFFNPPNVKNCHRTVNGHKTQIHLLYHRMILPLNKPNQKTFLNDLDFQ